MTTATRGTMTARTGSRRWAFGLLAATVALAPTSGVSAEEQLAGGMKIVGVAGAISASHATKHDTDTVTGYQLLPHVGYVVTDPYGPGWLRGNFEILLEPALILLESTVASPTVVGLSVLPRWVFMGTGRYRPYLEAGAGVLLGETDLLQTDCAVNFLLQVGPGLHIFLSGKTALTVGYRFQHISNAGACQFNVGINSSAVYLGVSHFFR